MKCIDFENRLNDLLDDRRLPQDDAILAAHADECADCREMLAGQESLFRGIAAMQQRTVLPELGNRVLSEFGSVITPVSTLRSRAKWNWLPLLASAVALLIAVTCGYWLVNRGDHHEVVNRSAPRRSRGDGLAVTQPAVRQSAPLVKEEPVLPSPAPTANESIAVSPAPSEPPGFAENGAAYRHAMASLASKWSTNAQWPHMNELDVERVEHFAPGIRPIRESFEVALDALLRTIPGKKEAPIGPPQALQANDDFFNIA